MALQNSTLSTTIPSTILTAYGVSATANVSASVVVVPYSFSEGLTGEYSSDTGYDYFSAVPVANLTLTYQDAIDFEPTSQFITLQDDLRYGVQGDLHLHLRLTPTGCSLGGTRLRNCSEICVQKELIFNDPSTLANCMAFPFMSQLLDTGILSDNYTAIAQSYGIVAHNGLANEVTSILRNCFKARCQLSKSCKKDNESTYEGYNYSMANMRHDFLYEDGYELCEYVDSTVLGDIAGIGVSICLILWHY